MKLFSRILEDAELSEDHEGCNEVLRFMLERIPMFESSDDLEAQERVSRREGDVCIHRR